MNVRVGVTVCLTKDSFFDEMEYTAVIWKRCGRVFCFCSQCEGQAASQSAYKVTRSVIYTFFHRYFDSQKTHFLQFIISTRMQMEFYKMVSLEIEEKKNENFVCRTKARIKRIFGHVPVYTLNQNIQWSTFFTLIFDYNWIFSE